MNAEEWVVLELSPRSEGEDPDAIRKAISRHVPNAEVFVPAVATQIDDDRVVHKLVEGYAFVQRVYPDSILFKLEGTRFVQGVLVQSGSSGRQRRPSIVSKQDVDRMRRQIQQEISQGIGIGDKVLITTGAYKNIEATVIEEIPETGTVQVFVHLRSKQTIVSIPRSGLQVVDRSPLAPFLSRLTDLRAWLRQRWAVLLWESSVGLEAPKTRLTHLEASQTQIDIFRQYFSLARFLDGVTDLGLQQARQKFGYLQKLTGWLNRGRDLFNFITSVDQQLVIDGRWVAIRQAYQALATVYSIQSRIQRLRRDLDVLASQLSHEENGESMVQNVLVDGNNLARRCFHAPGMSEIKTSKGVPTGVVLGFLRSLGSLHKRFPGAQLVVAWDGSARRRKKVYGEYKAGRGPQPDGFMEQVDTLRKILPPLGVSQASNPEEEADDIIAALVRERFSEKDNVIFSSDRDFLQLVSSKTSLLTPSAGIRKEVFFDEARVLEHYGVPPSQMLQLRALVGDDTDNIPGVARVPKKVLCSLIQAHGSVDGVYRSGLTGVSKGQYERLRSSEPQVRINLALMAFAPVTFSVTEPDVDPDLASSRMQELEINPSSILDTFFGHKTEIVDV